MPVDSLFDMARRACARYSARITDIGDLNYELIRPVLLKIESPEKLHQLEQNSPQIIGKDAEIWMSFIKRDIPDWHLKRHEPKNPKNWYKVYRQLKEEARMDSTADEAILKAALANIQNEKEQNTAEIASSRRDLPYLTPSRKARIHYSYISGKTGSKGANKMTLMEKIRKEARDAKASQMNRPMHELQKRATVVTKAPRQFVEDLKQKAANPMSPPRTQAFPASIRPSRPPMHAPTTTSSPKKPPVDSSYDLVVDREARLRALKNGKSEPNPPRMSSTPTTTRNGSDRQDDTVNVGGNGTGILTTNFLEDSEEEEEEEEAIEAPPKMLKINDNERPRSLSPMRLSHPHPQTHTLKRKQVPSLFMSSPKKTARQPGVS
ncbi:uncharacterized protein Z518_09046 [Rhinocladiella mackenziei CBS 650.93]|uniref:Elongin-A n=1 Tax=Rhinocladiella mackenziei CBS 650.93 TaxID=1442369 RepID=A0A0D2IDK7_9EURO|nr:uncharacterized protein Z518_09046 [Rhinocladiella mackenziei CBS 650.93]KIX01321.1 hypothetical protein Z518_09046 [Rhinocladiella mackenziei CBS 650.93]